MLEAIITSASRKELHKTSHTVIGLFIALKYQVTEIFIKKLSAYTLLPHTGGMRFIIGLLCLSCTGLLCAFPPNTVDLPAAQKLARVSPAPAPVFTQAPVTASTKSTSPAPLPKKETFELGITHLRVDGFNILQGKRVGLLTHAAAVDERGYSSIDILRGAPGVKLVALYAPEHGLNGQALAEKKIDNASYEGLPVYSLYGDTRKPTPQMLKNIDCMVIDLQDIGSRSYTYISSMKLTMQACFERGISVVVLDRPNPLGGLKADGPVLDPHFQSYVGLYQIPYIHGLTIGELALVARDELKPLRGSLTVVKMTGWKRTMLWSDTELKWHATSPSVPTAGAAFGYACCGLGAQLGGFHHGYGTQYPFRFLSHPKITATALKARLERERLPGFAFEIMTLKKGSMGDTEEGVYVRITNWDNASPIALSLSMLKIAQELEGRAPFAEASNSTAELFCKHWGRAEPLNTLRQGHPLSASVLSAHWKSEALHWQSQEGRKYWLYSY
jgi:uncharacterized protein YbbC (DUF1343 family)